MRIVLAVMVSAAPACERKRRHETQRAIAIREDGRLAVRAMTFNVRYENSNERPELQWSQRLPRIIRIIHQQAPGVIGIQEARHGQAADLWASLPGYEFAGIGRDDGKRAGEYTAILFQRDNYFPDPNDQGTRWFSDTPLRPGSTTWGNSHPRVVTWIRLTEFATGRSFYAYNLHWDHRSQPSRQRSSQMLAELIRTRSHPEDPVILLGDFNATEQNPAFRNLLEDANHGTANLLDTFAVRWPNRSDRRTMHGFSGSTAGDFKIDHILASQPARVVDAEIIHDPAPHASDHFAVTATIEFPPPSGYDPYHGP